MLKIHSFLLFSIEDLYRKIYIGLPIQAALYRNPIVIEKSLQETLYRSFIERFVCIFWSSIGLYRGLYIGLPIQAFYREGPIQAFYRDFFWLYRESYIGLSIKDRPLNKCQRRPIQLSIEEIACVVYICILYFQKT